MEKYYLGVDGGGTKTAFAVITSQGDIRAAATKGNADLLRIGADAFKGMLESGIAEVCAQAGIVRSDLTYSVFGIPCLEDEIIDEIPMVEEFIREVLQNDRFLAVNDAAVGWAGSLACSPGLHLVAGTGAIGYGVDPAGNAARSSGWGHEVGDEGSAYWLGHKVLSLFTREADGREKKSGIYEMIRREFEIKNDFELLKVMNGELGTREAVAALAIPLHRLATAGEEKAIRLFADAACELALIAQALIRRLQFEEAEPLLVSYSGGVFRSGEYVLGPLRSHLSGYRVSLVRPRLEPVLGAALYALHRKSPQSDLAALSQALQAGSIK